ncbi:MAG TPA: DNA adenine methylase [Candidatus Omnitrophota bacterium]|nr:DNA adenine methylase [Candidatus Omnitrophota bacterium]
MGSKKYMLMNGLGTMLRKAVPEAEEFVDLFSGSGEVSKFVSQNFDLKVTAVDLQKFSAVFTDAVIGRTKRIYANSCWKAWEKRANAVSRREPWATYFRKANKLHCSEGNAFRRKTVTNARIFSEKVKDCPITQAYGGHYFSPLQALWIDALRTTLPKNNSVSRACLAALIQAASRCAAAPGHTAQPFQPTKSGRKWIYVAWRQDVVKKTKEALVEISKQFSKKKGEVISGDANEIAKTINEGALVFIDPPYSDVQYSRFYHVLETIAHGKISESTGVGRYPSIQERPQSDYSSRSKSKEAIKDLLKTLSSRKANVILTFPEKKSSNGLSGRQIERIARKHFTISESKLSSGVFSTLGGNNVRRKSRMKSSELILRMKPKKQK